MSDTAKKVQDAGLVLGGLGVIGFLGIIWLMIYGNLSGALVFPQTNTTTYTNESGYAINDTTYTLTGAGLSGFRSLGVTAAYNSSSGLITVANYTVSSTLGTIVGAAGRSENYTGVYLDYTVTRNGQIEETTDSTIGNITEGFGTFFGFSNTFFTIAAIILLIFMLLGLLSLVMSIVGKQRGGRSGGYSKY